MSAETVILRPDGAPARQSPPKTCPRCGSRALIEVNGGFGGAVRLGCRCGYEFPQESD